MSNEIKEIKKTVDEIFNNINEQIKVTDQKNNKIRALLQIIEKANQNISKIDIEIEKILQALSLINSNLVSRKGDITKMFDKLVLPSYLDSQLFNIFESLKAIRINPGLIKLIETTFFDTSGKEKEEAKFETLFDFTNYDSVKDLLTKTTESHKQISEKRKMIIKSITLLEDEINLYFDKMTTSNSLVKATYEKIKLKCEQVVKGIDEIMKIKSKIKVQYERVGNILSSWNLNKNSLTFHTENQLNTFNSENEKAELEENKKLAIQFMEYIAQLNIICDDIEREFAIYQDNFNSKKELYNNLLKLPNTVKETSSNLETSFNNYESELKNVDKQIVELKNLINWYSKFLKSYESLFPELRRRREAQKSIEVEVEKFRLYLTEKFEKESFFQRSFNDNHINFLPQYFHPLLSEIPQKYEIYPKKYDSVLKLLEENIFNGLNKSNVTEVESPENTYEIRKRKFTL